jgi:hypothetical protein
MADTMRAVVLDAPGPVENLQIRDLPLPEPRPGWVRIKVMAFGLNRSELHTRLGYAQGVTFPRVLGIEAVGVVDAAPDGDLEPGQQVATLMGGMGRVFDGGYAEYTVVPRDQIVPFTSDLPWHVIGAVPETLQTAYGSLTTGLDLSEGQTLDGERLNDGDELQSDTDTRPPRRRRAASPNRLLSSIPGARRSAGPAQKGYGWSDGSIVIHLSSVNSLITARPSKRPYPLPFIPP